MGSSRSKGESTSRSFYTPAQLKFQEQGLGLAGQQIGQGFVNFGRQAYDKPIVVGPSGAQTQGLQNLANDVTSSVDYSQLRGAANASFASRVQNVLGPELRERAGRLSGYGSDYGSNVARPIAEQALNLETYLTGLEANSMESAKQRQLGVLNDLPNYYRALDPNQAFDQDQATAAYQEYISRLDPQYLQALLSAIPNQQQSDSRSKSDSVQAGSGGSNFSFTGGGNTTINPSK
jgi:hypothetical protein